MRIISFIIFVFTVLVISSDVLVEAHGLGQSLEKNVGDYILDVGYDAIDQIETNLAIRFDFNLWTKGKADMADFDHVWVRISPNDKGILFAGFLYRPEFLLTGMSYTFQKSGQYDLTVRFLNKEDKTIAEATFPLMVKRGEQERKSLFQTLSAGIGGLIVGVVAVLFFKNKNNEE